MSLSFLSLRNAGLALVATALLSGAGAAEPLTLPEALAIALKDSPALQAYAFEPRLAEARIIQAAVKPNPELSVGFENFLGTGALSGVKGLETTLQLSQLIDLADSRGRRVQSATAERELAEFDYEAKRIEVLAEVARRFTEAVADAERLTLARQERELGEQTLTGVRGRLDAAKASPLDLNKARTALALLQIEEEHAEHELAVCRQSLAAALGKAEPIFGELRANLLLLPVVPEFGVLATRMEKSPVLARHAVEARWREAQVRLAESLRRAGPRLHVGVRRVEATDDFGVVAGISIPLSIRDQSSGHVREARDRRAQLDASTEAARFEMRATLFEVYQEMLHARTALAQLQQEVIPAAEETLTLAKKGYGEGRYSVLELLDAQKSLVELRRQVVTNAATFHLHVIEIERLLGAPLAATQP
jgi:cobalt-zinc-cadmium efflux system outer membrane protein